MGSADSEPIQSMEPIREEEGVGSGSLGTKTLPFPNDVGNILSTSSSARNKSPVLEANVPEKMRMRSPRLKRTNNEAKTSLPTGVESIDEEIEESGSEVSDDGDVKQTSKSAIQTLLHAYKEAIAVNDEKRIADIENQLQAIEDERDILSKQIASLREESLADKARLLRLNADFANFRKRVEKERISLASDIKGEVIASLLPMIDSFEVAKTQIKTETEGEEKLNNSYLSIYKQFVQILRALGVSVVETVGHRFDPTLHEAIIREESTEFEEGIIIEEFRQGFKLGDRLLRPATVKVSAGPAAAKSVEASAKTSEQSSEGAEADDSSSGITDSSAEAAEEPKETTQDPERPASSEVPMAES